MANREKNVPTGGKPPKGFVGGVGRFWKKVQSKGGLIFTVFMVLFAASFVTVKLVHLQLGEEGEQLRSRANAQIQADRTLEAVRGSIYDTTGKVLATNSVVWTIGCDPGSSTVLYTKQKEKKESFWEKLGKAIFHAEEEADSGSEELEEGEVRKSDGTVLKLNKEKCREISEEIACRLLSGDGTNLEAVDRSSSAYQEEVQRIYDLLSQIDKQYVILKSDVNNAVKLSIEEYVEGKKYYRKEEDEGHTAGSRLAVMEDRVYQRIYPYGEFAGAVLGFCSKEGYGQYGLEASYQTTLAGVDGRLIGTRNAQGTLISTDEGATYEAENGQSLVLSLDATVQEIAERYLDEAIVANNVKNGGCAIVMDVNTGAILAMASYPDFDPNHPDTFTNVNYLHSMVLADPKANNGQYETDENGKIVRDYAGYPVVDETLNYTKTYCEIQWRNKAITDTYYPGSIFKVVTSAMALDSGKAVGGTQLYCKGYYEVADQIYHCAGKKVHGWQDMALALRNSCNIYYVQLGQRMGASAFYEYFQAFGFTEQTGVDLPAETKSMQYYTAEKMGSVELASSSFGQSMTVTPLQMCAAIAACTNGGYLVTPHIVESIVDENGNVVSETGTISRRQVISKSASDVIRSLMEYEVGDGSTNLGGANAYVAGYRIGGKSGTSEKLNTEKRRSDGDYKKVASFVGVLPINDPQILVYVMLDDPNNAKTDYSSVLAAPVVGNIISEVAPYLGLEKDGIDRSGTTVRVPNLIGTEWSNAQVKLNTKGLEHRLVGGDTVKAGATVTYQYPVDGMDVPSGTTIYLYTDSSTGETTTVPDVSGKTGEFARQILRGANLNCIVTGNGTVQSQSVAAGTEVRYGTIVTVNCG